MDVDSILFWVTKSLNIILEAHLVCFWRETVCPLRWRSHDMSRAIVPSLKQLLCAFRLAVAYMMASSESARQTFAAARWVGRLVGYPAMASVLDLF